MNKRQRKKKRKALYRSSIEDVTLEISLDKKWRGSIFSLKENEKIIISYLYADEIPAYIKKKIVQERLEFFVSKLNRCEEIFGEGMVIFMFQSKEFPDVVRYSGNNPEVL